MSASAADSGRDDWTVRKILQWTTEFLRDKGCDTPRLDAEILLAHVRRCARISLYTAMEEYPTDAERAQLRELVKRRAAAEPVAYLVGHREFFSLRFEVTSDTFIPRPETELLVMEALDRTSEIVAPRILDIGAGTGCIGISIAYQRDSALVTSVDISPGALAVARRNAETHNVVGRVTFLQGDLFEPIDEGTRFDMIVSNPPYIAENGWDGIPSEVRLHEPRTALTAGPEGLDVYVRLIPQAYDRLHPGGWLALEISPEQNMPICEAMSTAGFRDVATRKDGQGLERVVVGRR